MSCALSGILLHLTFQHMACNEGVPSALVVVRVCGINVMLSGAAERSAMIGSETISPL